MLEHNEFKILNTNLFLKEKYVVLSLLKKKLCTKHRYTVKNGTGAT